MKKPGYHTFRILVLMAFLLPGGCIEPFEPDIEKYENILVVDGLITDKKEVYTIRLSRTLRFDESRPIMETGALVEVVDDQGNLFSFNESSDGIYTSDTNSFVGVPGRSYMLMIQTQDGAYYASSVDLLKAAPVIDSVFYKYKEETLPGNEILQGIEIILDTDDPQNGTRYYRWEWLETWEFSVPYTKLGYEAREFCWASEPSDQIVIASTMQLSKDVVNDQRIYFVDNRSNRLLKAYSTLIRQYALTETTYSFWREIELLNEHTGSLFDPPPASVTGNVMNENDPDEPVLGFFQVSGVSEKRFFFRHEELPSLFRAPTEYEFCSMIDVIGPGESYIQKGWIVMLRYFDLDIEHTILVNFAACYDCTARGSNKRPDYWID